MIRQLFHGSPSIIEKPQFGYGKVYNDYGLGFYCTDSLEMAKNGAWLRIGTGMPTAMSWTVKVSKFWI